MEPRSSAANRGIGTRYTIGGVKSTRSSGDVRVSAASPPGSKLLLAGASLTAGGLALAGTIAPRAGVAVLIVGWLVFAYSLHAFGRDRRLP